MKEIEVKILGINRNKCEKTLISLGAKKIFDGEILTLFYDYSDSSIQKAKNLLRLRKAGVKSFLTFKQYVKDSHAKVRKEFDVEVSDFDTTHMILKGLGLTATLSVRKHRSSYILNDVHFEFDHHLDEYVYIPDFLEIEAKNLESLYQAASLFGFKKEDCRPWSFFDVATHYKKKKKSSIS